MPSANLTDVIVALLQRVTDPCHRRRGSWHHRRPAFALTPPASAPSNPRVLERPPSPSSDRPVYRPMEPMDHDASPSGHPCTIHGWGPCPNPVASTVGPSSRGHEEEEEGEENEELRQILVVPRLRQRPLTRRTTRKTISP
jgi:hypothetical protein